MAQWRKVSMKEAIVFVRDGHAQPLDRRPEWAEAAGYPSPSRGDGSIEWFDDGTAVACASDWHGPYSHETPDVDAEPPEWFVYC